MENSKNKSNQGIAGYLFEANLYLLLLHKGVSNEKYNGFILHREKSDAAKFDDLVFEFQENGIPVYRLLQAKHTIRPEKKKLNDGQLFASMKGDFDLVKYFVSYRDAIKKYSKKGRVQDFIICTNRNLDENFKTEIEWDKEDDDILNVVRENGEKPKKFHIKATGEIIDRIVSEYKARKEAWEFKIKKRWPQSDPDLQEIGDYLKALTFVIDVPSQNELGVIVKDKIGKDQVDGKARQDIYNRARTSMENWMIDKNRRNFWTHDEAKALFDEVKAGYNPHDVCYKVQPPVKRFVDRKQLDELDELLQREKQVMICGFGGVGKTELVRGYIKKHSSKYDNNILWIDAENDDALIQNFRDLASGKIKIEAKGANGEEKDISIVINEAYRWFQKSKSLFVFDDAKWHQYQDYIQPSLPDNVRKPYIIVISRVKWQNEDLIARIDLSEFTQPEAIRFISESLPKFLENGRQGESVEKLAETLQYLPLALRQAIAYINVKFKLETKTYQFSEYIENFSKKSQEYLDYAISKYCESKYDKTVWTTWDITVDALQSEKNYTPEVLNYMSFLLPNDIHADLLSRFIKEKEKLKETILLLDEYSLITVRESFYSLHRLVQLVTREKLKRDERREVLKRILEIIAEKDDIVARGVDHFTSAWMHFKQSCTEVIEKYYHVPATIAFTLFDIGRYKEAFSLGIEALELMNNFSFKDEKEMEYVQNIAPIIVRFLSNSDRYETALNKSKEVLTILKDINKRLPCTEPILTIENDIIVIYLHMSDVEAIIDFMRLSLFKNETVSGNCSMISMFRSEIAADMWSSFFAYEYALECYYNLIYLRANLKFSDPDTLRISKKIAKTYYQDHLCEKAIKFSFLIDKKLDFTNKVLSILREAHEEQKKTLSNNHSDRLDTQEGMISLLVGQGKYEEALALFEDISDESLARNNCSLLTKKATVLAFLNENDSALDICENLKKDILFLERGDFKKNHPEVVDRCVGVALALSLLSKFDEALQVLGEVWVRLRYSVRYNFHVAKILTIIAHIYLMQNKRFEGLSTLDELWLCYGNAFYLYYWKPQTLRIFIDLFLEERQLDSALRHGLELINTYEHLPESSQSTWPIKRKVAKIYFHKKDYGKALSMLIEVKKNLEAFREEDSPDYQETCKFMILINHKQKVEAELNQNQVSMIKDPFEAVKRGNLEQLKKLIEGGTDVNASDENDWTLLHHAASGGKRGITEYLLQSGADTTRVTKKSENTVLHIAVTRNHFDFVELLLNFNYDKARTIVNAKTSKSGTTALHIASKKGLLRMARLLLTYGAAYDAKNQAGKSPLDMASGLVVEALLREVHARFRSFSTPWEYGALELFKNNAWLQFQAVFNARNDEGDSLFKLAVVNNCRAQVISILDSYEVDHNLSFHMQRDDVLYILKKDEIILSILRSKRASRVEYVECINEFLRLLKGIRCICKNYLLTTLEDMSDLLSSAELSGEVETLAMYAVERQVKRLFEMFNCLALLEAARRNDLTALNLCLDKYPHIFSIDAGGQTAWHYAAAAGNATMVELLLDRDAGQRCGFLQPEVPLHLAAKNGHIEVARLLLWRQSEFNYGKTKGTEETALHLAAKNGHLAMVKLLLEYHADYGYRNNAGQTPADVAASQEIKDLLALIDELHGDADAERVLGRLSEFEPAERRPLLNAIHPDKKPLWQVLAAKCTDKRKLLDVIGEQIEEDSNSQAELTRKLLGVMLEVNENRDKYY